MYFIDEDGTEKPTVEALSALNTIVMFRSEMWFMAIVDMVRVFNWYPNPTPRAFQYNPSLVNSPFRACLLTTSKRCLFCFAQFFKFVVVSLLGVVFQNSQVAGACVSWLCCASIMAFFAFKRPYLYEGGNYLSVASYGSLLAAFTGALTGKLEHDGYGGYAVDEHFKNLLFAAWLLPYIVAFVDLVNLPHYLMRAIIRCRRQACDGCVGRCTSRKKTQIQDVSKAGCRHQEIVVAKKESIHVELDLISIEAAFASEHKRGQYILSTFRSLLPIVREIVHAADAYSKHVR